MFYQPETGTGFGLVTTYYFRTGAARTVTDQPSSLQLISVYTTKKQIILRLAGELYTAEYRNWITGQLDFSRFPNKYWGVGNDTPDSAEEDYTPQLVQATAAFRRRVGTRVFLGARVQFGHRRVIERLDTGLLASGGAPGAVDGRIVGGGLLGAYDSRSSNVYPRAGTFVQVELSGFDGAVGSDFAYGLLTIDARQYVTTLPRHVLAMRVLATATTGAPPFDLLPRVGGDVLLRGYFDGRFRDRHLIAGQVEYRLPVVWRFGVVGFAAAGQVADRFGSFGIDRFKTSIGGGLRFLLSPQEGLNVRADFAYGLDVKSSGFYLAIGEAF